jgi:hypothetical protein
MKYRMTSICALGFALLLMTATAFAAEEKDAEKTTHDGKVVSVTSTKLVMTNQDGKEHSHRLAPDATMTLDGKACKSEDLKAGTRIRVTTKKDKPEVATNIEAIEKDKDFKETE